MKRRITVLMKIRQNIFTLINIKLNIVELIKIIQNYSKLNHVLLLLINIKQHHCFTKIYLFCQLFCLIDNSVAKLEE